MTLSTHVPAPYRRAAVILCALAAMIEGFDIQAAGVVGPRLAPALGLGPGEMGLFFSAAIFGLIVGALIGGRIADRLGRKAGLICALAVFGLFSIATAFAWDFPSLFILRFLTGIGLGGALPNLIAIAAESSPARPFVSVTTMYAGLPTGGAIAALVSVVGGQAPWAVIFIVGGVAPLLLLPFLAWFLPKFVVGQQSDAASNRALAVGALFGPGRWGTTLALWIGFFFSLLVLHLLLNWLPILLVARGVGRTQAGIVQILFNLAGAVGSLLAGRMMEGGRQRSAVAIGFGGLIAALLFLAATPAMFAMVLLAGGAVGITVMMAQAILYSLAPMQYPAAVRGTGVGAAVAAGRLGSVVGPLVAGALFAVGGGGGQVLAGIVPVAALGGIATLLLVWKPKPAA